MLLIVNIAGRIQRSNEAESRPTGDEEPPDCTKSVVRHVHGSEKGQRSAAGAEQADQVRESVFLTIFYFVFFFLLFLVFYQFFYCFFTSFFLLFLVFVLVSLYSSWGESYFLTIFTQLLLVFPWVSGLFMAFRISFLECAEFGLVLS